MGIRNAEGKKQNEIQNVDWICFLRCVKLIATLPLARSTVSMNPLKSSRTHSMIHLSLPDFGPSWHLLTWFGLQIIHVHTHEECRPSACCHCESQRQLRRPVELAQSTKLFHLWFISSAVLQHFFSPPSSYERGLSSPVEVPHQNGWVNKTLGTQSHCNKSPRGARDNYAFV